MLVTVSRLLNTLAAAEPWSNEAISRAMNAHLGGDPDEMLCSRAHREGWRLFCAVVDVWFWIRRGEVNHCAQRWSEHEANR